MSAAFGHFPGLDPATGMVNLPLWAVGAVTGLLVALLVLAINQAGREGISGGLARLALLVIGASTTLFFVDGAPKRELATERQALETRAVELLARVTLPGSALACLDGVAGDTLETPCEKAVFASPESTAAAVSYVSAELALLADYSDYLRRAHTGAPATLVGLRHAVEADRFGFVAQVLAERDGCTPTQCQAFALLSDKSRVVVNLSEHVFDLYVSRYAGSWPASKSTGPAVAATSPPASVASAGHTPPGELFFPSAASIPPINIMTSEPPAASAAPDSSAATTGAVPASKPPTPPRRPQSAGPSRPVDLNASRAVPPATASTP